MRILRGITLLFLATFLLAPLVRAEEAEVDPNEVAEDYAKEFQKGLKKASSAEIIEGIDQLVVYWNDEKIDDRGARKEIFSGMEKATRSRDPVVVAHVLNKCADMGSESVRIVLFVLNRELSQKVPNDTVYETAFTTMGKLASIERPAIDALTDYLNHKDNAVVARAARAISGYENAAGEVRKMLFEEVIKSSEGTYSGAQAQNSALERKWNVIGDDEMSALNKLSGATQANPAEARRWFNDNKTRSWDPVKDN